MERIIMEFDKILPELTAGIIKHCEEWNYDWVERLMEKPTVENFFKLFCKFTKTYYFDVGSDYYGARFKKSEETVEIYKCGKNCHDVLAEGPISELVSALTEYKKYIISEKKGGINFGRETIQRKVRHRSRVG